MKAISLWEPWASAMALGLKTIETRGWSTRYRGPLAIHAAKRTMKSRDGVDDLIEKIGRIDPQLRHFSAPFPYGCVVAIVNLDSCHVIDTMSAARSSRAVPAWRDAGMRYAFPDAEIPWGNYEPGRFAWMTSQLARLRIPAPVRGAQGLWEWDEAGNWSSRPVEPRP